MLMIRISSAWERGDNLEGANSSYRARRDIRRANRLKRAVETYSADTFELKTALEGIYHDALQRVYNLENPPSILRWLKLVPSCLRG